MLPQVCPNLITESWYRTDIEKNKTVPEYVSCNMDIFLIAFLPTEQRGLDFFASDDFCPPLKTFFKSNRKAPNGHNTIKILERNYLTDDCDCNFLHSLHESLSQLTW